MLTIRAPQAADEAAWRQLWAAYCAFYRHNLAEPVTAALWGRLTGGDTALTGFVAERGGTLIGFAHTVLHASTWSLAPSCYLEDLFVSAAARGSGAGAALIEAAASAAQGRGADRIYWHTQEYNAPARSLYDTLAQRTSFIVYRRDLPWA